MKLTVEIDLKDGSTVENVIDLLSRVQVGVIAAHHGNRMAVTDSYVGRKVVNSDGTSTVGHWVIEPKES